jgi:CheY-like chemotaxis protein
MRSNQTNNSIETPALFDDNGQLVLVVDDEAAVREISKVSLEAYIAVAISVRTQTRLFQKVGFVVSTSLIVLIALAVAITTKLC